MFSHAAIKSRFFANLAQFSAGGNSYPTVIHHLRRSPDADIREWASWLVPKAHDGAAASLTWRPDLFSVLDREIVASGEQSECLAEAFQYLSQFYVFVARMERELARGLRIPALLLLGGTMILAAAESLISGGMHSFWMHCGPFVFALGLGVAGIFLAGRWGIREAAKNAEADRFLRLLPVLGKAWQRLAESRLALALSLRIQAGLSLASSLELSGDASRSILVRQKMKQAIAATKKVQASLPEIFQKQRFWSPPFLEALHLQSATQGDELRQAASALQQQAMNQIETVCNQIPKIALFIVLLLLFWKSCAILSGLSIRYLGVP